MLALHYQADAPEFEFPFTTSKGSKTSQPNLIVSLSLGRLSGWGETTSIGYYNADVEEMIVLLEKNRKVIESYALTTPERFWHFLHHLLPEQNFLIAALDIAAWDLFARMRNTPLYNVLGLQWKNTPPTDYTIGIDAAETIADRLQQKPFPIYKLKVGGEEDLEQLKALRQATDAIIRIDANEAWDWPTAQKILPQLADMNIELIEQPFHREDWEALRKLKEITTIPIIADEACRSIADLTPCLELYDGINIKLSKCGGITPALGMLQQIKKAQKKVMLGGMCEHIIGATAIAQLLPLADYADIDGPLLLKPNNYRGLTYDEQGNIRLPDGPGLGITPIVN